MRPTRPSRLRWAPLALAAALVVAGLPAAWRAAASSGGAGQAYEPGTSGVQAQGGAPPQAAGEARTWEPMLEVAERLATRDPRQASAVFDALAQAPLGPQQVLRLGLARSQAAMARFEPEAAEAIATLLLPQAARLADERTTVQLLLVQAQALFEQQRTDAAFAAASQARHRAHGLGDARVDVDTLLIEADLRIRSGDFGTAAALVEAAEARAVGLNGAELRGALALANAQLAGLTDDVSTALPLLQAAGDAFAADGNRLLHADALRHRAALLLGSGQPELARVPAEQALVLYEALGDGYGRASVTSDLAQALSHAGEHDRAQTLAAIAVADMQQIDDGDSLALALRDQARVLLRAGRLAEAQAVVDRLRPRVAASADQRLQINLAELERQVHTLRGRWRDAHAAAERELGLQARRSAELLSRQLAVHRGRLESRRLTAELKLAREAAQSQAGALEQAQSLSRLQGWLILAAGGGIAAAALALHLLARRSRDNARLAHTDGLTNLPNRRRLEDLGGQMLARRRSRDMPLSVLMIDIDHFKRINDRHGHAVGDEVLRAVAAELQRQRRGEDTVARQGGEEFAALLPGTPLARAAAMAERLRAAVAALAMPGLPEPVTVSVGVAEAGPADDLAAVLARADEALYAAKQGGRNRVVGAGP